jgi:hypothetical protein
LEEDPSCPRRAEATRTESLPRADARRTGLSLTRDPRAPPADVVRRTDTIFTSA